MNRRQGIGNTKGVDHRSRIVLDFKRRQRCSSMESMGSDGGSDDDEDMETIPRKNRKNQNKKRQVTIRRTE
jgi:hypothetical protein